MAAYLARRIVQAILILFGITLVTFVLLYVLPADPARQIAGRSATAATVENIRHQLGLDQPLYEQYWRYLSNLMHGDLGRSFIQKTEVSTLIASRIPASLLLMAGAIACELLLGISAGVISALNSGRATDRLLTVLSFIFVSAPPFVVGIVFLYVFAAKLRWFPIGGYGSFSQLMLPSLTLGLLGAGWYAQMIRASMLGVLQQDYIRTAKAEGLTRLRIVFGHAFPNAVLPIVAMIGIDIGFFMSGIVVVESVFGWPGIGQLAWVAIQRIDIPLIMGVTLISAVAVVIGNLLADIVVLMIDPRIKVR